MITNWKIEFTKHARERMWERDVAEEDVLILLEQGRWVKSEDSIRVQLDDPRQGELMNRRMYHLLGVIVVLTLDGDLVKTVMRDDKEREPFEVFYHLGRKSPSFTLRDALASQLEILMKKRGTSC